MPKRKQVQFKLTKGPVLMALAALWLGYRALTTPGELGHLTRFANEPGPSSRHAQGKSADPVGQIIKTVSAVQGKVDDEHAALDDIGNPDGISRMPAGQSPTVAFERLTPHCPSLNRLKTNAWFEIDEMGQVLSIEPESKGPAPALGDCRFEPYRGPNGRPLAVRALYTASK